MILMGDRGQLPPVSDDHSMVFDHPLQETHRIKKLTLSTIMRSKDRLTQLSKCVRELIPFDQGQFKNRDIHGVNLQDPLLNNGSRQILYYGDQDQWINEYVRSFRQEAIAPIMLVYTNAECDYLNQECRNRIFNSPAEAYVEGELLIFRNYYSIRRQKTQTNKVNKVSKTIPYYIKFFTLEQMVVKKITTREMTILPLNISMILGNETTMTQWVKKRTQTKQVESLVAN